MGARMKTPAPGAARPGRAGFTLIEVMGALVIFTVGVIGALQLSGGLGERLSRAALRTRVVEVAHAQVDSLRTLGYSALPVSSSTSTVTLANRSFRVERTVVQYSPLVKRIDVIVEPSVGPGPAHTTASFLSTDW